LLPIAHQRRWELEAIVAFASHFLPAHPSKTGLPAAVAPSPATSTVAAPTTSLSSPPSSSCSPTPRPPPSMPMSLTPSPLLGCSSPSSVSRPRLLLHVVLRPDGSINLAAWDPDSATTDLHKRFDGHQFDHIGPQFGGDGARASSAPPVVVQEATARDGDGEELEEEFGVGA
jgi:hypothetical protein